MPTDSGVEKPPAPEPVFNTFRRKTLRPFYSLREFQIGIGIVIFLGGVLWWVLQRGAHPDPNLFQVKDSVLSSKGKDIPIYKRPVEPWVEPGSVAVAGSARKADLGPFPDTILSDGWRLVKPPEMFDESNVYIKIDGRENFYKSYGFKKMHCASLVSTTKSDFTIDIEMFDLSNIENSLGAFSAEISDPATTVNTEGSGLSYLTKNSGFIAQGQYYVRLIGSDDQDLIRQKISALRDAFAAALPRAPLPWAYDLFVSGMKFSPAAVQFQRENAFSYGFANEFYVASIPGSDTEVFISWRGSADEALAMTGKLADGFAAYGKKLPSVKGTALVANDFVKTVDALRAHGTFVTGVRMAKNAAEATDWLDKLTVELDKRPNIQKGATPAAAAPVKAGSYE